MKQFLKYCIAGGCVMVTFHDICGHPATVLGNSMSPTLNGSDSRWWKNDIVWLTTYKVRWGPLGPNIGDVVSFISPRDPRKVHIKRVTGIEGNMVRPKHHDSIMIVPKGTYWMESDNPVNANDSNIYGPVAQGLLCSRATYIIWPPNRWKRL